MWADDTMDLENGTNDVDDCVSGYIRTDSGISISFNGAWAQNIPDEDKYIDFLGDKGGVRLNYWSTFKYFDGQTLETEIPEFDIPGAHHAEDVDFIRCLDNAEKNRCYIDNILETMKLLDTLYKSSDIKKEIEF
jgi:predicted dehydrogenase